MGKYQVTTEDGHVYEVTTDDTPATPASSIPARGQRLAPPGSSLRKQQNAEIAAPGYSGPQPGERMAKEMTNTIPLAAGAVGGTLAAPLGPVGAVTGAGLGAGAGSLVKQGINKLIGQPGPNTPSGVAVQAGQDALTQGALPEVAGQAAGPVIKALSPAMAAIKGAGGRVLPNAQRALSSLDLMHPARSVVKDIPDAVSDIYQGGRQGVADLQSSQRVAANRAANPGTAVPPVPQPPVPDAAPIPPASGALPSGRVPGSIANQPPIQPPPMPPGMGRVPAWKQIQLQMQAPGNAAPIPGQLPSGRIPGPAAPAPPPPMPAGMGMVPAWKQIQAQMPTAPPSAAPIPGVLPSGRVPGSIENQVTDIPPDIQGSIRAAVNPETAGIHGGPEGAPIPINGHPAFAPDSSFPAQQAARQQAPASTSLSKEQTLEEILQDPNKFSAAKRLFDALQGGQ